MVILKHWVLSPHLFVIPHRCTAALYEIFCYSQWRTRKGKFILASARSGSKRGERLDSFFLPGRCDARYVSTCRGLGPPSKDAIVRNTTRALHSVFQSLFFLLLHPRFVLVISRFPKFLREETSAKSCRRTCSSAKVIPRQNRRLHIDHKVIIGTREYSARITMSSCCFSGFQLHPSPHPSTLNCTELLSLSHPPPHRSSRSPEVMMSTAAMYYSSIALLLALAVYIITAKLQAGKLTQETSWGISAVAFFRTDDVGNLLYIYSAAHQVARQCRKYTISIPDILSP